MSLNGRALLALAFVQALAACQYPAFDWDVANVSHPGQSTTWLSFPGGGFCGLPVEMGDYDGDGSADYAMAPLLASSGPGQNRFESGEVIVIGGDGTIGALIDLQNPPPGQPLLRIYGGAARDYLGTEMFSADVTGDGTTDLIVGAMGPDPHGRDRASAAYIIPGGPGFGGVIDLANPPSSIIVIEGADPVDRLGIWVEAGDVNGDGTADVLLGADGGDGLNNAHSQRGEVVVLFGGQVFPPVIDLANPPAGLQMTTVFGLEDGDHFGTTIYARDLDADGYDELVVGAAINRAAAVNTGTAVAGGNGPGNTRPNAGEVSIIWGRPSWPPFIDLANPDPVTAASLTVIYGADAQDTLGEEITSADIDGDGYEDLAIGALTADGENNAANWAGDVAVVYGGAWLRSQTLDMALLPAGTSTVYGTAAGDITGDTLSGGDVNQDGFGDFMFGSPHRDVQKPGGTVNSAGAVDVLFGSPVRWPSAWVLGNLGSDFPVRQIWGAEVNDLLSYSMEAGDFDGDGFDDVFPNAMRGDGFNNTVNNAGEINVVSGRELCRGLTVLGGAPKIGTAFPFNMTAEPLGTYLAAFSLADSPTQPLSGGQSLALAADLLFWWSLDPNLPYFTTMAGTLDATGRGQYGLSLPAEPSLVGLHVYTAFVTYAQGPPLAFPTVSATTSFVVQP